MAHLSVEENMLIIWKLQYPISETKKNIEQYCQAWATYNQSYNLKRQKNHSQIPKTKKKQNISPRYACSSRFTFWNNTTGTFKSFHLFFPFFPGSVGCLKKMKIMELVFCGFLNVYITSLKLTWNSHPENRGPETL